MIEIIVTYYYAECCIKIYNFDSKVILYKFEHI